MLLIYFNLIYPTPWEFVTALFKISSKMTSKSKSTLNAKSSQFNSINQRRIPTIKRVLRTMPQLLLDFFITILFKTIQDYSLRLFNDYFDTKLLQGYGSIQSSILDYCLTKFCQPLARYLLSLPMLSSSLFFSVALIKPTNISNSH